MIEPARFFDELRARGIDCFAGVPDSLLKHFCAYVTDHAGAEHVITANEGNAVALAIGHHLATGRPGLVYLQNSGLGNIVNPLTSLADPEVYRVPMLLVIGWRGEPGKHDEPQHVKQGRITPGQLDLLEIPYQVLDAESDVASVLDAAFASLADGVPHALLVRADTFAPYKGGKSPDAFGDAPAREEALAALLDVMAAGDLVVSTTGKASRELFELRMARDGQCRDFLTVGGMGHTASISFGVARAARGRRVVCVDGDGSVLMHLGAMPVIAAEAPRNLVHVVLNNAAHESVGGQPTVADRMDLRSVALGCGYRAYERADSLDAIGAAWGRLVAQDGPVLLEVRIRQGSRADLGRPTSTPEQNKRAFMDHAAD